jgi:hypothetical protein
LPDSEAAGTSSGMDTLPGQRVVYPLISDKESMQLTMLKPGSNFAACNCNTGQRGSLYKHQVAWLLAQYPYGGCAARFIVKMLGTRLGFVRGCTMHDIQDLTMELCHLQLQQPSTAACLTPNCPIIENHDGAAALHLQRRTEFRVATCLHQQCQGSKVWHCIGTAYNQLCSSSWRRS